MHSTDHLNSLQVRLSNEHSRFKNSKTEGEKELRGVWCKQIEKEIEDERARLGLDEKPIDEMTDDEIFAYLGQ